MDYRQILKSSGLSITKQRIAILDVLSSSNYPLSINDIQKAIPNAEFSTIYRTLDALDKANIVKKEKGMDKKALYSLAKEEHKHYLLCVRCGEKVLLDSCPYHAANEELEEQTGFSILDHDTIIKGICPSCQKAAK